MNERELKKVLYEQLKGLQFEDLRVNFRQGYFLFEQPQMKKYSRNKIDLGRLYYGWEVDRKPHYFIPSKNLRKIINRIPENPDKKIMVDEFACASRTPSGYLRLERVDGKFPDYPPVSEFSPGEFETIKKLVKISGILGLR
jgi:hypothetical protein